MFEEVVPGSCYQKQSGVGLTVLSKGSGPLIHFSTLGLRQVPAAHDWGALAVQAQDTLTVTLPSSVQRWRVMEQFIGRLG